MVGNSQDGNRQSDGTSGDRPKAVKECLLAEVTFELRPVA